jgi:hypothetical protein
MERADQATIDGRDLIQLLLTEFLPPNSPGFATSQANLGGSFLRRYERFGEVKDIDNAIEHLREAIRLASQDSPELPTMLSDLGVSLMRRFERLEDVKDIDNAV